MWSDNKGGVSGPILASLSADAGGGGGGDGGFGIETATSLGTLRRLCKVPGMSIADEDTADSDWIGASKLHASSSNKGLYGAESDADSL